MDTPEEYCSKYDLTHTELGLADMMRNGSLIKNEPGDKNITANGKIPGKNLIESQGFVIRENRLRNAIFDALDVKAKEFLDLPVDKLAALAIKMFPQKVDSHIEHEFTFAEWAKKCSVEIESYHPTIDAEAIEINDTEAS